MVKLLCIVSVILISFDSGISSKQHLEKMTGHAEENLDVGESRAPWNFSWIVENQLAAMSWPKTKANLNFLWQSGIRHLVTLSPEMVPPINGSRIKWTLIPIEEFEPPTLDDIKTFISICETSLAKNESVGVHCRMGLGRTGVMAACFMVHFYGMPPQRAIDSIRSQRPWSVETYEQEKAVAKYYDFLKGTKIGTTK